MQTCFQAAKGPRISAKRFCAARRFSEWVLTWLVHYMTLNQEGLLSFSSRCVRHAEMRLLFSNYRESSLKEPFFMEFTHSRHPEIAQSPTQQNSSAKSSAKHKAQISLPSGVENKTTRHSHSKTRSVLSISKISCQPGFTFGGNTGGKPWLWSSEW